MIETRTDRMTARRTMLMLVSLLAFAWLLGPVRGAAQAQSTAAPPPEKRGQVLDQVVAVVNGDLILESDIDEERRFMAFQPFRDRSKPFSRSEAIERLIDRTLILQQADIQPGDTVSEARLDRQLNALRRDIPACKQYHCETDAGWKSFVEAQGFTVPELEERWRERMRVLRFIELRFRSGIRISPDEIKSYYEKTLLPEYGRLHATPPKLEAISDRIQEILLQQQVSALLDDWLNSLKAQGNIRMTRPGEAEP